VSDAGGWLARRSPPPPAPLTRWLGGVDVRGDEPGPWRALLQAALGELGRARAAPGRVRASAFHLLAADALVTYACEAALDEEDPADALGTILSRVAAPEP
jgi:hypothetical protein